ncbi:MAG: methionine gamma-lyase [Acidobacteriaceae bacterium]|nr:methionine gamma-lyase [Acidobacteriaceae bacterium]
MASEKSKRGRRSEKSSADALSVGTRCVHAGENRHGRAASLTTDIAQTSVFALPNVDYLRDIVTGKSSDYYYTRNANPTTAAAEEKIAALEGGSGCVVTSSGTSALLAAVLAVCGQGDEIVSMLDVYGGTIKLFDVVLGKLGIKTTFVPYGEMERLERYCSKKTKLLFLETPTNPTLRCIDLAAAAKVGHKFGATVIADNTFATPILQRPLELGCDVALHSATKYLGGHSDLTAGAVVSGDKTLVAKMRDMSVTTGGVLDPGASYLLLRGLKTLEVRVEKASQNAKCIAQHLRGHKKISRVMFPGFEENEGHEIAKKQMRDFGMMVSIEIKGGGKSAERFINSLKLWYLATSLGGVESTVSYPVLASHVNCSKERLKLLDVSPATVRLSVGIESCGDLIADLEQALRRA